MLHKSTMLQEVELETKLLLDLSDSVNTKNLSHPYASLFVRIQGSAFLAPDR